MIATTSPSLSDAWARTRTTRLWLGALAVAGAAAWLAYRGDRVLTPGRGVWASLKTSETQMIGPALLGIVVLVVLVERAWPAVPRPLTARAHLVDAGYLALYTVVAPFVTLLDTGFAQLVRHHAPYLILGRLPLIPQAAVVAATLLGIDGFNWAAHVANHRSGVLWRFHALHHSQEDMSVLTTFRTHPLTHFSYLPAVLPALLLGASGPVPASALIAYGCLVTLPHANLPWTYGPLGRVVVSPAFHRLHHSRAPVAGHPVVNFGFVLTIWDRLAGLAAFPDGGPPVETGIAGRPVPVEQAAPGRLGFVVLAQLADPLRPPSTGSSGPSS